MILSDPLLVLPSVDLNSLVSGSVIKRGHITPKVASFNLSGRPVFDGTRKYKDRYFWTIELRISNADVLTLNQYVNLQPNRTHYLLLDDLLEIKPESPLTRSVYQGLRSLPTGAFTGYGRFPVAIEFNDDGEFPGLNRGTGELWRDATIILHEIRGIVL